MIVTFHIKSVAVDLACRPQATQQGLRSHHKGMRGQGRDQTGDRRNGLGFTQGDTMQELKRGS